MRRTATTSTHQLSQNCTEKLQHHSSRLVRPKRMVALFWLGSRTYLPNRRLSSQTALWHNDNPADCASRSMLAADLVNHSLWWKGPHWLYSTEAEWVKPPQSPHSSFISDKQVQAEVKSSAFTTMRTSNTETSLLGQLIDRVSSWPKLLRILAYVLKFIRRHRRKSNTATLTFEEIHDARILYLNSRNSKLTTSDSSTSKIWGTNQNCASSHRKSTNMDSCEWGVA